MARTNVTSLPWHANHSNLMALATHLHEVGELMSADEMLGFFEKPWHWDDEWNAYQIAQDASRVAQTERDDAAQLVEAEQTYTPTGTWPHDA